MKDKKVKSQTLTPLVSIFIGLFFFSTLSFGWGSSNSPTINISPTTILQAEGNSGTSTVTLTITASDCPDTKDIKIYCTTVNGTATTADNDYVDKNGTVTFQRHSSWFCNDSDKEEEISITINGDTVVESDENFTVTISDGGTDSSQSFTIDDSTSTITITNDDSATPVADAGPDQSVLQDTNVTLDGSGSNGGIGAISYSWDVNGHIYTGVNPEIDSADLIIGNNNITLTITDGTGDTDTDIVTITVIEIVENANDLCYEGIETGCATAGICFCMNIGPCGGGMGCMKKYPLRNRGDSNLSDIVVDYDETGLGGSFGSDCGVETSGTCSTEHNIDMGPIGLLGQTTEFDLDNSITPGDTSSSVWVSNFMSGSCFKGEKLYGTYIKDGKLHRGKIKACGAGGNDIYLTGPFDAWDTFRNINDRNISTKIVNKDFNLTIASLNSDDNGTEVKDGIDMQYQLYDINDTNITSWEDYNATAGSDGASSIKSFLIDSAKQNVRVRFKFCAFDTGSGLELASLSTCTAGSGDYNSSYDLNTSTYSSDNFAIRPYAFKVFGENQYKRAGEDFNLTIKAIDENNNTITSGTSDNIVGISDYNKSTSNLNIASHFYTPNSADIAQMQTDTGETNVTGCPNIGTFTINNTNFSDGETNVTLKFSETGILDVNISEQYGQEFAKIDEDDTNDSQRYIEPAVKIYDKSDISKNNILLFIPYSFTTTATYNTTNGKNWLYINDINKSNSTFTTPKMAAYLTYTIKAYNKNNILTKNYTKTCFPDVDEINCPRVNGLKLNTTFDLFLDMDINSTANADLSLYSEDNTSSAIWTFTKNQSILMGQNSIREWISPFQFENGVGQAKVYFNIDRNLTKAVNPIIVNIIDANTSTSWMSNPGSPKNFNGALLDINKTFYYGRVHAPDYRFDGNSGNATIYYEVYCKGCNQVQYNISTVESVDSINWYLNTSHTTNDGNVTQFIAKMGQVTPNPVSSSSISSGIETINLSTVQTLPYKDKIQMQPSTWLIYNLVNSNATTNDFLVEFFDANASWAGQGIQGRTIDLNISGVQNKRLDW